jgi:CopG family nickel-responsive transcriptional regulator
MPDLERISFTIDGSLLRRLETMRRERGYENRSELIRDLIRDALVKESWESEEAEVLGTAILVFDHHQRQLGAKLTEIQHEHHDEILASTHVHLDRHTCAEAVLMRGAAGRLRRIADTLSKQKGVLHGGFVTTSTGNELK